jgi:acetyl-CoA carboxylase biotin carboxyl carrier protein
VELDLKQLQELLGAFNQTQIAELHLKSGEFELTLKRHSAAVPMTMVPTVMPGPVATPLPEVTTNGGAATPPPVAPESSPPPSANKKWVDVISPMVGTFYRSPAPDEAPFVEVGETIRKGQVVCIIEAMKLMNEIESEANGQIMEILVQNGEPVEYGQVLMRLNPG